MRIRGLISVVLLPFICRADVSYFIGDAAFWTGGAGSSVSWQALSELNDANDGLAEFDFVGDSNDPAAFWASQNGYLFFRMRVATATVSPTTFSGSHFVMIDVVGLDYDQTAQGLISPENNPLRPDYALVWDSKSNDPTKHGLEMSVRDQIGTTWDAIQMTDIDSVEGGTAPSQKGLNDINGGGRTTDGYVRAVDSQATTSFGTTSYLDYAVSWTYLSTYTELSPSQTWKLALASINNNDHLNINEDVAGGASPLASADLGWMLVPEPRSLWLSAIPCFLAALCAHLRRFSSRGRRQLPPQGQRVST